MKSLYEIEAAAYRAQMRQYAMAFRTAIAADIDMSLTERGILGTSSIRGAVRMRKNAERAMQYHRAYRKAEENIASTSLLC